MLNNNQPICHLYLLQNCSVKWKQTWQGWFWERWSSDEY